MNRYPEALIIGCGVSGLSTGIRLREAGYGATIWARALPPHTTSNIAAAVWYPYKAYPEDLVTRWSARSYTVFVELAGESASGVVLRQGVELFAQPVAEPWWRDAVPDFRRATPSELLPGFADGYVFTAPVIETPRYLRYLLERFQTAGGRIVQRSVASLAAPFAACDLVVNCAGLGARDLVVDPALHPIRGQIVRVAPLPPAAAQPFIFDEHHPHGLTYIVPRSDGVILGGTAEADAEDLTPDPATAAAIRARATALQPALSDLPVLEHLVGLRPGRAAVRLELESQPGGKLLVHNYGHGGAGVTLSWGCAEACVELIAQANSGAAGG